MTITKEITETPSNKSICYMAAAILEMDGVIDNRHPFWSEAVRMVERAYNALYDSLEKKE